MQSRLLSCGVDLTNFYEGDDFLLTLLNLSLKSLAALFMIAVLVPLAACQPSVKVEAPEEPITINLNIKLDADVRLRLEEEAREDIEANPDVF
jgi:hypothetical protein